MRIIGHRGARGLAPENTIAGLEQALKHHVDEIEFDVRVSSDHIPLLHHDDTIVADTQDLKIREYTFAELKAYKPDLCSLAEALDFVKMRVPLLVEVKPGEAVPPVAAVLRESVAGGIYKPTQLAVGSFSQATLRELHHELPGHPTVVIERWSGVKASWRARQVGAKRMNMKSLWLWSGFLRAMHRRGYRIAPYTVNDPAKIKRWRPYLDGVITDRPDLFKK